VIQDLFDAASLGSLYALMALGIALVFGVMGLVNFAYGELIMIGGYTALIVAGAGALGIILTTVLTVTFAALLMERLVFRPARGVDPATLMVISFALSIGLQSLAIVIEGARPKSVNLFGSLMHPVQVAGARVGELDITSIGLAAVLVAGLTLFLKKSVLGLRLRAAAEDFTMSRLLGVRTDVVFATAFALSGALAAAAALILTAQTGALSPDMGSQPVLVAFVATVIGGLGSLAGAAIGGFLLGMVSVLLQLALPVGLQPYTEALVYAAVIAVLLLRPGGLLGSRHLEERA
jgi:branched-chain amino acid transport system permease protein